MRDLQENFAKIGKLHLALRETRDVIFNQRILIVFAIIVLIFAVTGPFGTREWLSMPERLAYWLASQGFAWIVAIFSIRLADSFASALTSAPLRIIITGAIAGLPVGLVSWASHALLAQPEEMFTFEAVLNAISTSVPLTIAFSALCWLAMSQAEPQLAPIAGSLANYDQAQVKTSAMPAILERLPLAKRGQLLRLSAADHYVEVVTANGRELLLMRLQDAIELTQPETGLRVHRSHWVACTAMRSLQSTSSGGTLTLIDGTNVPVSRAMMRQVRDVLKQIQN